MALTGIVSGCRRQAALAAALLVAAWLPVPAPAQDVEEPAEAAPAAPSPQPWTINCAGQGAAGTRG